VRKKDTTRKMKKMTRRVQGGKTPPSRRGDKKRHIESGDDRGVLTWKKKTWERSSPEMVEKGNHNPPTETGGGEKWETWAEKNERGMELCFKKPQCNKLWGGP